MRKRGEAEARRFTQQRWTEAEAEAPASELGTLVRSELAGRRLGETEQTVADTLRTQTAQPEQERTPQEAKRIALISTMVALISAIVGAILFQFIDWSSRSFSVGSGLLVIALSASGLICLVSVVSAVSCWREVKGKT